MSTHFVFFVSDHTGISVESLGRSLLGQFDTINFEYVTYPYIDTIEKAQKVLNHIDEVKNHSQATPLLFSTVINPGIRAVLSQSRCDMHDFFGTFLPPLEKSLGSPAAANIGRTHGINNYSKYMSRISAVDYALSHDDGLNSKHYDKADLILIGVSRCGKTPTSLYMALQFGLSTANFPFTDEIRQNFTLPHSLLTHRDKLFGLTISPQRLHEIRSERLPDSEYASLQRCEMELKAVENLYIKEQISFLNTTQFSIEEISTKILARKKLKRRLS